MNALSRILSLALAALLLLSTFALNAGASLDVVEAQDKVEPLVLDELAADGTTDYFVWMTEKADLSPAAALQTKEEKGRFVFETLSRRPSVPRRRFASRWTGEGSTTGRFTSPTKS